MRQGFLSLAGHSLRGIRNLAPVPYTSQGQRYGGSGFGTGLFGQPTGMEAQMRAMGGSGTLFSIVDRIITSYSQVEWHLYRKAASGKKEDRREVTSHAVIDLMNHPNDFMTGPAFLEAAQQHEELTGEQWWVCAKSPASKMPLELWPVRPDRMRPVADPKKFCIGYEYVGPSGEIVPLGLDEVIFQRRPNPLDPYRGLGPVQTILTDLDASRFSREWNRQFFVNSAEPGGILQVTKRLSDQEFNEARNRWAEQHKGIQAAHRVAIIENGIEWVDRRYTNRDMQFTELLDASRETIREAFGFPKPMTGATDDINRANADAGEVVFARWLMVPRLQRQKAVRNHVLLPMYGDAAARRLEWDYDNPVPEDLVAEAAQLTSRANAAAALIAVGLDAQEVLPACGLPEMRYVGQKAPLTVEEGDLPQDSWQRSIAHLTGDPQAAMRWVAVAVDDADTCQPCRDNDGHLYRNRADAYKDYPGGTGYVNCIGAKYGNACRCRVVKRRKGNDGQDEED